MVEMGNVWDRTAEHISDNLGSVVPVALLMIFAPTAIYTNLWDAMSSFSAMGRIPIALTVIALVIVSNWGQLTLVAQALDHRTDREARAVAFRRLPMNILAAVLIGLSLVLLLIPCSFILLAAGVPTDPAAMRTMPQAAMMQAIGMAAIYLLVLAPFVIWALSRLVVLTPVIVNEGLMFGAFARAFRLTRGVTLKIIGVCILYVIVSTVAQIAVTSVFGLIFRFVAGPGGALSLSSVLTSVFAAAVQTGFVVLATIFTAKLYQALIYDHATARA